MFDLGVSQILTGLWILKSVATVAWQEYEKGKQAFLKLLGRAQTQTAKNLSDALGELVARGKNKGLDSYELYRNLEKLLPLLCLDASHRRVKDSVEAASVTILEKQERAMRDAKLEVEERQFVAGRMRVLLLWDPECAAVFKVIKEDGGFEARNMVGASLRSSWGELDFLGCPGPKVRAAVVQAFRKSVEGIFDRAKEIHDTQREFAAALCESDALRQSYVTEDQRKAAANSVEAWELCDKLNYLFNADVPAKRGTVAPAKRGTVYDIVVSSVLRNQLKANWQRAAYPLVLLIDRFGFSRALKRKKREIDALFDAVGATDAEREEIESHINSLYGAIHRRWLEDDWIQCRNKDVFYGDSPFFDRQFLGWRKATSKRRKLFLEHYDLFQLKSPRQLTEEGVLGLVQTLEAHEDKVFVRTSRLNIELQEILNRAVNNERHGKFDAAIADLKTLLRRVSEASGPNAVDYPDETLSAIPCYLACIYASRGENLEEAVELARRSLEIQDSLLARLALGWSYHRQGKVAAIEELEVAKSAAMHAESGLLPLVHLVLGDAYRDAERHQDAEEAWQAGWELADDPEWKAQAGLTKFEVAERAGLRKELSERLGLENSLL